MPSAFFSVTVRVTKSQGLIPGKITRHNVNLPIKYINLKIIFIISKHNSSWLTYFFRIFIQFFFIINTIITSLIWVTDTKVQVHNIYIILIILSTAYMCEIWWQHLKSIGSFRSSFLFFFFSSLFCVGCSNQCDYVLKQWYLFTAICDKSNCKYHQ